MIRDWESYFRRYEQNSFYAKPAYALIIDNYISLVRCKKRPLDSDQAYTAWVFSREMAEIRWRTRGE